MRFRGASWWSIALVTIVLAGCEPGSGASPVGAGAEPGPTVLHDMPAGDAVPTPAGVPHLRRGSCVTKASADRCEAMAFAAAGQLGVPFERVAAVDVVPGADPGQIDFAHRTFLSVTLVDGSSHPITISCPGVSAGSVPACMTFPTVPISFPRGSEGGGGYTDVPEGASPFPGLDPAAVAAAQALRIAALPIPITQTGTQQILLGRALLANGYLAEGHFALADPWPSNVLFDAAPRLEVRTIAGGVALGNLYEHGWHDGVEAVEATLTFEVAWFEVGTVLGIIDVVVR
jgi:hypothetical protein